MSHLFLELGVMLAAVYTLGQVVETLGKPAFLGELLAGVLVGPEILGLVSPDGVVHVFATVGAASLFFHVGYEEVDLAGLFDVGRSATAIAAFGMVVPFLAGVAVGWAFDYGLTGMLFLAVALSITSIAITVRTLTYLGKSETRYASKLVGAAVIDDVVGMVAFALLLLGVAGSAGLAGGTVATVLAKVVGFFALAVLVHALVADVFFARVLPTERTGGPFLIFGALLALFGAAAEFADLHATIGAFVAGLIAGHGDRTEGFEHESGVEIITYGVFGPLFFAAVGMRVDFSVVASLHPILLVVAVVGVLAKVAGGYLGNRVVGGDPLESVAIGVGLVPRTGVELVIVSVALERGFVDQRIYAAFILLVVVSVLLTPLVLQRFDAEFRSAVFR